ncbi:AMP-binding protein [Rhodococcus sp. BP-252]|uniref:AMP-binding protein n=1 Tax=unclassified Rhodococcus (in: high G+C Gram-positive bacteria) TaxID=192944 RepID=UPI001C9BB70D|nr:MULTISPECIES: AMP-binding protein [unclassified Rhodococcus (in: high G+C Gram-positive bacteria)]MBY6411587.1 AMP-binding protein [Rhodococcus sp. BP-320]MBY6417969.1 AMP-binding protein [Rhodococcus sp. BP-321]MBY6422130.1 AMP-binding protein [Rhodococcus sp. BP-324]MBY6427767.1 AMP-binding protein [Rhodococcus sp. BP-323]MBY6433014.1 AMP-binding protein [Rhodococcus sp. BP-322]
MLDRIRDRATEDPNGLALVDDRRTMTWAEVVTSLDALAERFVDVAPRPDDRIAVVGENTIETLLTHVACIGAGVGTVAVSRQLKSNEMADQLVDSGSVAVVTGPVGLESATGAANESGSKTVVVHGHTAVPGTVAWADFVRPADGRISAAPESRPARPPLVYTSGTTGRARGTQVRWLPHSVDTAREFADAVSARSGYPDGVHLVVGPLQHNGPLTSVRHLLSGRPVVIMGRFDAERTLAAIESHSVTSTLMVPTHFQRLLALPHDVRSRYDTTSLKYVAHTGSACPPDVKRSMIDWFGPVLIESYGGSEIGTVCRIDSTEWLEHPRSVGRAIPPFDAVVVGSDGTELGRGEVGVLGFRTPPERRIEYHADPEKTAAAYILPNVATLGDVGYVDDDGYVFITDRVADMVVSGGVNLYPAESERVLSTHPDVAEVAVIGVPDDDLGEALLALVVPCTDSDVDVDDLAQFAKRSMASYKCPKKYVVVDELTRNAMGKLDKKALRAPFWSTARTIAG